MIEEQEKLQELLDNLVKEEDIEGCGLVSRDGIPILSSFSPAFDQRVFSILVQGAMVATLMGAAEEAMEELDSGDIDHVTVETASLRLVSIGATEELVFLAITDPNVSLEDSIEVLTEALDAMKDHL